MHKENRIYRKSAWQSIRRFYFLLGLGIAIPVLCVLWFMLEALQNERLAVKQNFIRLYEAQLKSAAEALEIFWQEKFYAAEKDGLKHGPASAFKWLILNKLADGAVIVDEEGQHQYPESQSIEAMAQNKKRNSLWFEAEREEFVKGNAEVANSIYQKIINESENIEEKALSVQSSFRCLLKLKKYSEALTLVEGTLIENIMKKEGETKSHKVQLGVLVGALTSSYFLEDQKTQIKKILVERLNDYENTYLKSSERRFFIGQLIGYGIPEETFPTMTAEAMTADLINRNLYKVTDGEFLSPVTGDIYSWHKGGSNMTLFFHESTVRQQSMNFLMSTHVWVGVELLLVKPDSDIDRDALASFRLSGALKNWQLKLKISDQAFFEAETETKLSLYLWTGFLIMFGLIAIGILVGRLVRQQIHLTRIKNSLVTTVSHELKTPLSSIRLLVETLLEKKQGLDEQSREYLQLIAQENSRLSRLIHNFLTFSRLEANQLSFNFGAVNLNNTVRVAIQSIQEKLTKENVEVYVEDRNIELVADADLLVVVLTNLIDNAIKYGSRDRQKEIFITAREKNSCVEIKCRDNGMGLNARDARKIFERFYRVDNQLSRSTEGCGLGLNIVSRIIEGHSGTIDVESQLGVGTTFIISLPKLVG